MRECLVERDGKWPVVRVRRHPLSVAADCLLVGIIVALVITFVAWRWGERQYTKGWNDARVEQTVGRVYDRYPAGH